MKSTAGFKVVNLPGLVVLALVMDTVGRCVGGWVMGFVLGIKVGSAVAGSVDCPVGTNTMNRRKQYL